MQSPGQAAQTLLHSASDDPSARHARRRTTLADLRSPLQGLESKHLGRHCRAKVALALYTLARIAANLYVGTHFGGQAAVILPSRMFDVICDGTLRPAVGGLGIYVFLHRMDRFSSKNPLHFWSFVTVGCLAIPVFDLSGLQALHTCLVVHVGAPAHTVPLLLLSWEVGCNVLQVRMTALKLQALGWRQTAKYCDKLTAVGVGSLGLVWVGMAAADSGLLLLVCCGCTLMTLALQSCALCHAARVSMAQSWWTASFLYANACLVPLGPVLSFAGLLGFLGAYELPETLITLDVTFQIFNVLLLSGMLGTIPLNLEALERLAELSGFGLASKRINFPGHISDKAADCVVSFPGKYSELWDMAVSSVTKKDAFSLACVFLTDTASGLGKHVCNPHTPGKCWCHQIYGPMQPIAYLSPVDLRAQHGQNSQEVLAFKKADAEAMGQRLLVRQDQGDVEWERELEEALQEAEDRCAKNQALAPWGCQWFEAWKSNVDKAKELQQMLHVFYFKGRKGKGKMDWELLCDEGAVKAARKESGLGASQTAEVAYLDKIGLSYVEHDIGEFEAFLATHERTKLLRKMFRDQSARLDDKHGAE